MLCDRVDGRPKPISSVARQLGGMWCGEPKLRLRRPFVPTSRIVGVAAAAAATAAAAMGLWCICRCECCASKWS